MPLRNINNSRRKILIVLLQILALLATAPALAEQDPEKTARQKGGCDNCGNSLQGGTSSTTLQGGTDSTMLQGGATGTMFQTGTASTMLQTGTQSTMLQTGTQSTTLQTGTQSTMLQTGATGTMIQANIEREAGPINILFIVDCSYSMKEGLGGSMQKMDAAKQVLQNALSRIPNDINIGLRVFGQSYSENPMFDCQQSTLLVPLGQGNRRSIIERVRQVHPFGLTPLTFALSRAEQDFRGIQGEKTVILITDGMETCGGHPCEFVKRLNQIGIRMKVDIVGLALKRDKDARNQLNCIAESSGGHYFDADTAAQLIDSVSRSVDKAISGRVLPRATSPNQQAAPTSPPPNPTPADTQILNRLLGK